MNTETLKVLKDKRIGAVNIAIVQDEDGGRWFRAQGDGDEEPVFIEPSLIVAMAEMWKESRVMFSVQLVSPTTVKVQ